MGVYTGWSNFRRPSTLVVGGILIGAAAREIFSNLQIQKVEAKSEVAGSNSNDQNNWNNGILTKYGSPRHVVNLSYSSHRLQYDFQKRIPLWVSEHLTKASFQGPANRQNCTFKADNNVPDEFRSHNEDYLDSGYSRGHMMPAADVKTSQEAMSETFYLSNIIPQNPENNAGFWYRMEDFCRELVRKYSDVYVISGPLFLPTPTTDPNIKLVTYQVIGKDEVAVPTHLYKVVLVESNGTPVSLAAFVVPNKDIEETKTLKEHQVPLKELQRMAGLQFFPKLQLNKWIKDLCHGDGCKMMSKNDADLKHLRRSVHHSKTVEQLDKIMNDINTKKIQVDKSRSWICFLRKGLS